MFFSQIIGQEKAKHLLESVVRRKRVPHAYLFTGVAGIGKTSTAKAFTMMLNCDTPSGLDGCGGCPSCRKILNGNFPDFITLEPDGQKIKIEQIRELNRSLGYAPFSGGYRVCVIHKAEAMTGEAANSFLKTLEEPPPGNIFVLNAAEPRDLLPTIVSRCQRVSFRPLKIEEIIAQLTKKTALDGPSVEILARAADGSLGRALRMSESDYLERRRSWIGKLFDLYGCSGAEALNMAVESAKEDRAGLDQPGSGKAGLFDMLSVWASCYRDLLLVRTDTTDRLLINDDFRDQLKKTASGLSFHSLLESFRIVDRAVRDLHRMRNPTLVLENALLNLQKMGEQTGQDIAVRR
ncbi:MAG: DNA polymerase III subunit delta' [Deltaproteobacteria bacterium]|nr:DNA polymerase III subunit delta' [Deltaproteobacteria bacterium]